MEMEMTQLRAEEMRILQLADSLKSLVRMMVDHPNELHVTATSTDGEGFTLTIKANSRDVGKVIGKMGRTARSLRSVVNAISMTQKFPIAIDILDSEERVN